MHENMCCFGKKDDEFHTFASELSGVADIIVLSETWFSSNTCHDVQGYTGFHTYCANKQEAVSLSLSEIVTHRPIGQFFSVSCIL